MKMNILSEMIDDDGLPVVYNYNKNKLCTYIYEIIFLIS